MMNYETRFTEAGGAADILEDDDVRARRRRRMFISVAVLLVVLLAGIWFFMRGQDDAALAEGAAAKSVPTVTVFIPGRQTVERTIAATGSLAARREMPVGVAGEGGMVTRVLVEPGQWVSAGQVLATIDRDVQVEQANSLAAQINVARADARIAQSELDRSQALLSRGFISKADIDRKTATRDSANARVRVAQAQLNEAQARTGRLDIRAPAAGLVLTRAIEPGQVVSSASGILFRLAKGGEMELLAQLSEGDLAATTVGVNATVTPVGTAQAFKGQVWQVSPIIDPQTRQGTARIALSYDVALRPGGFAAAKIISGSQNAPLLPESAVQSDEKGNFVYVVGKDNKIERRGVTVGEVAENGVAINAGLNGTERVVLSAGGFLNAGETVNPVLQKSAR
ncbi:RND family efflux transporter MFP subunit [Sphingobium boeckii]|uniref:RND family efflux transporter MFP subunit n=2 Tax=Sphingobium boeckii TaxID=1082345 RepID=A0A7W9AFK0_9SPHN|nr:RND family efflux transporter MFP subunit [Sphingobium boeckii]